VRPEDESRLEEIEIKLAFVEHTVTQLDDVIRAMRDKLEEMQRDIVALREQQASLLPPVEDAKPPHW
jgi:uncharacterized coiled-coil protein SlyX